jgi:hypothetical protein
MDFCLKAIFEELVARVVSGPMQFRLILQPLTAVLLGIRDGHHDAKAGTPPLIWSLLFHTEHRKLHLINVLRRLTRPIIIATVIDVIVQYLMFRHVRPLTAVIVGTLLIWLPYSIARGLSNRIITMRRSHIRKAAPHEAA